MERKYAYLGDVTPDEYKRIITYFPLVKEIGSTTLDDGTELLCVGMDDELPDDIIGMHQLIIQLWDDDDARQRAFDIAIGGDDVTQFENVLLKLKVTELEAKLNNISKILNVLNALEI